MCEGLKSCQVTLAQILLNLRTKKVFVTFFNPNKNNKPSTIIISLCDFLNFDSLSRWVQYFTSSENRHALPLFTSLLNTVCGYDPAGLLPYNHLLFSDTREELVEAAIQVLIITLDQDAASASAVAAPGEPDDAGGAAGGLPDNLFLNYLSRCKNVHGAAFFFVSLTW